MTAQKKDPAGRAGPTATLENHKIVAQWQEFGNGPLPGGFVRLPRAVLTDPGLRPVDKVVWAVLAAHVWNGRTRAWPSHSRIARMAGCSPRTVQDALTRLEQGGYVQLERRRGRTSIVVSLRFRVDHGGNADEDEGTCQPQQKLRRSPPTTAKSAGVEGKICAGGAKKLHGTGAKVADEVEVMEVDHLKKTKPEDECLAGVVPAGQRPADPPARHYGDHGPANGDGNTEDDIDAHAREVLEYLNGWAGTHWRPNDVNLEPIRRRLREGYDVYDLMGIIDQKITEWAGTTMARHLKPAALFGCDDERFRQYLGESEHWAVNYRRRDRILDELEELRRRYQELRKEGASEEELSKIERKGKELNAQLDRLEKELTKFEKFMESS